MSRDDLVNYLAGVPARLSTLAAQLSPDALRHPLEDGWTPLQVLGHVRDSIAINLERFQRIVTEDQPTIVSWNPDEMAAQADYNSQSLEDILSDLTANRQRMVELLRSLDDEQWQRTGQHEDPQWGSISVEWLANHLRQHETEHTADIERVAARRSA